MSYQVLARKWRPRNFGTLIGQEHVVRALTHALATGRLHHAWLFTGTRGVGKTTISRILAKALNCETGVTSEPCGRCAACTAIDADRFPDYVEMDAASNRGVEDMAALLDKAVYAPVQGRYKVYMIDEVHMLTGHAFNAMLKTLEEPPEHVKFILATTDPQKIPVTVLSRCLQFNLKQMPPGHIVDHLGRILEAEGVPYEPPALRHLAKAACGSMRDALSLLDQAIAHGAGKVEEEQVTHMLGTVGDDHLYAVLDALVAGDVQALLAVADAMETRSLSFDAALQTLASLLHRIALAQFAPAAIGDMAERERLVPYADAFDAEFLQLAYQIAIHGREELALAPDDYAGFTMTLLRLHAFRPEHPAALGSGGQADGGGSGRARAMPPAVAKPAREPAVAAQRPAPQASAPQASAPQASAPQASAPQASVAPAPVAQVHRPQAPMAVEKAPTTPPPPIPRAAPVTAPAATTPPAAMRVSAPEPASSVPPWEDLPPEAQLGHGGAPRSAESAPSNKPASEETPPYEMPAVLADGEGSDPWHATLRAMSLGGLVRELAQHCEWLGLEDAAVRLRLSDTHRHLMEMNPSAVERLQDALGRHFGRALRLEIRIGAIAGETPAQRDHAERQARHAEAVASLERDPFVRELIERFDATLVEASIKAL